jgi:ketosteroid isomerase-like protein
MYHNFEIEAEIVACEQRLYAAQRSSDVALLRELIADDLVFVGPSGEIFTKQMDLELHRSGGMSVTELEPKEQEIRCMPNVAVAVTKIALVGTFQGSAFAGDFRYTRVWHYHNRRWQIIAGHCSAIAS